MSNPTVTPVALLWYLAEKVAADLHAKIEISVKTRGTSTIFTVGHDIRPVAVEEDQPDE